MGDENTSIFGVPPPDPELKRLEPLVGTWRTEDHTEDSVLGPGVPVTSTETYSWLDGLRVAWWLRDEAGKWKPRMTNTFERVAER